MFLDMAIFSVLAYRYKYNYFSSGGDDEPKEEGEMTAIQGAADTNKEGGHTNPSYKDD